MKPYNLTLELKNKPISNVLINAKIKVTIADQGIGAYEFWGAKGIDSKMGIDEIEVLEAEYVAGQDDLPNFPAKDFLDLEDVQDELYERLDDEWKARQDDGEVDI